MVDTCPRNRFGNGKWAMNMQVGRPRRAPCIDAQLQSKVVDVFGICWYSCDWCIWQFITGIVLCLSRVVWCLGPFPIHECSVRLPGAGPGIATFAWVAWKVNEPMSSVGVGVSRCIESNRWHSPVEGKVSLMRSEEFTSFREELTFREAGRNGTTTGRDWSHPA